MNLFDITLKAEHIVAFIFTTIGVSIGIAGHAMPHKDEHDKPIMLQEHKEHVIFNGKVVDSNEPICFQIILENLEVSYIEPTLKTNTENCYASLPAWQFVK